MDFSTQYVIKNGSPGEICHTPVAPAFAEDLSRTGMTFHVYYENVPSAPQRQELDRGGIRMRAFGFFCLLQLTAGDGYFYDGAAEKMTFLKPGDGLLVSPGFRHRYGGYAMPFVEDSICFSGPIPETLLKRGIVRNGTAPFGNGRRLLPVIAKIRKGTLESLFEARAELIALMIDVFRSREPEHDPALSDAVPQLVRAVRSSRGCGWSVSQMAEYANMSENYLRRLFRNRMGVSPKMFLDRLWLDRAAELVCGSKKSFASIAGELGDGDDYYFFRRFKKLTGLTPTEYRKTYSGI